MQHQRTETMPPGYAVVGHRTESTHHRLFEFAKTALIKIFVFPYASVCELFCGQVLDVDKWEEAQIGHYIGVDAEASGISEVQEVWESHRKGYSYDFYQLDPSVESLEPQVQEKCQAETVDVVCCMQHLQMCFNSEERAKMLLRNVSSLLKPGGYFFGITPDSSTIWAKYQKNVEAYHNKNTGAKPGLPNCIRSESYMITFEVEEEKFPLFGKKYQLKFASDASAETQCLVHFPTFIRLAREAGLEYLEIQNLTEFYDDNRAQFANLIMKFGPNLADPRARLLPRSYDVLGLYTLFVFQKPDPNRAPPLTTPVIPVPNQMLEEREWQPPGPAHWREEEIIAPADPPPQPPVPPPPPTVSIQVTHHPIPKINDQKGILGPGPAELRFPEPL